MSSEFDSRTPQFGLRDFLFYLLPGGILLTSIIILLSGHFSEIWKFIKDLGGLGLAILGIFFSYYLGQVFYPITYLLRHHFAPKGDWDKNPENFKQCHMSIIEHHTSFYAAVVFRDRSFARFSLAMVFPTLILSISLFLIFINLTLILALLLFVLGIISSIGFIYRYRHYDRRYREHIIRCHNYKWINDK